MCSQKNEGDFREEKQLRFFMFILYYFNIVVSLIVCLASLTPGRKKMYFV